MSTKSDIDKNALRWEGLVRASILTSTTKKLYGYIDLADRKAMGLIVLNSIIVPVAMSGIAKDGFLIAATIAILTSILSILMAIICVFPKRKHDQNKPKNLLHFADIGSMTQEEYLAAMNPLYNDTALLGEAVIRDIHDISRLVLIPKFALLKASYLIFFLGNLIAISVFLYEIWGVSL